MANKKTVAEATAANPDDRIFRLLSSVLLISSEQFARQPTTKQTSIIAQATADQPVKFVANFADLTNIKRVRDRLLDGKNVDLELEFNGIAFTEDERRAMTAFLPVLAKLNAVVPAYPWLNVAEEFSCFELAENGRKVRRNGHSLGLKTAKAIWDKASRYWAGGKQPASHYIGASWNSDGHRVEIRADEIRIGCQHIPRAEVEYLARWQNWEPVIG